MFPPHPADFLNDVLMPATGRSHEEMARLLGVSLNVFKTILARRTPISAPTAAVLGRLFKTGDEFWLKMQADYDRLTAAQKVVEATVVPADVPPQSLSLNYMIPTHYMGKPELERSADRMSAWVH